MTSEQIDEIREFWEKYSNEIMCETSIDTQLAYAQWLALKVPKLLTAMDAETKRADRAEKLYIGLTDGIAAISADRDMYKALTELLKSAMCDCDSCEAETNEKYDTLFAEKLDLLSQLELRRLEAEKAVEDRGHWKARADAQEQALRLYGHCCVCVHSDGTGQRCDIGGKCNGEGWAFDETRFSERGSES